MAWPKLYNVVKYRNELSSAGKIYLNNKLVSSAVIQSENANESTQIYNEKIYFLNAQSSPTQVCYFFSTQPFTNYFTLQRYIALGNNNILFWHEKLDCENNIGM